MAGRGNNPYGLDYGRGGGVPGGFLPVLLSDVPEKKGESYSTEYGQHEAWVQIKNSIAGWHTSLAEWRQPDHLR